MTFTPLSEGGEYQVTLTTDTMPKHNHLVGHSFDSAKGSNAPISGTFQRMLYNQGNGYGSYSKEVGGGQAHQNMQPYIGVYMWRRTA